METFGIQSPSHLLSEIETALAELRTLRGTTFRNVFFVLSGLNHLREWIAPGYKHKKPAKTAAERFSNLIHDTCPEWTIVNSLCNGLKHFDRMNHVTSDNASQRLADLHSLSGVTSLAHGHPQKFTVDGQDILEIFDATRKFYVENWFAKQHKNEVT